MLGAITSTYPIYTRVKTHGESKVQRGCFEATQLVDDGKGKIPRQFFALTSSPVVDSLFLSLSLSFSLSRVRLAPVKVVCLPKMLNHTDREPPPRSKTASFPSFFASSPSVWSATAFCGFCARGETTWYTFVLQLHRIPLHYLTRQSISEMKQPCTLWLIIPQTLRSSWHDSYL